MAKPCRPNAQEEGCQNHDGQSADHRADEGGNQHLRPSKRERRGCETCERTDDTRTSMNALTSQGTPIFGSTLERGVISAPARLASPAPMQNVTKRTWPLLMPTPARAVRS